MRQRKTAAARSRREEADELAAQVLKVFWAACGYFYNSQQDKSRFGGGALCILDRKTGEEFYLSVLGYPSPENDAALAHEEAVLLWVQHREAGKVPVLSTYQYAGSASGTKQFAGICTKDFIVVLTGLDMRWAEAVLLVAIPQDRFNHDERDAIMATSHAGVLVGKVIQIRDHANEWLRISKTDELRFTRYANFSGFQLF